LNPQILRAPSGALFFAAAPGERQVAKGDRQRDGATDSISLPENRTSVGCPVGEPPSGSSDTA
jgi:hypothetical protein